LFEQLLQKRPAPSAASPRAEAFRELALAARFLDAQKVNHLPLGDVEAEAEFVVEVHEKVLGFQCSVFSEEDAEDAVR
jgi:hypothetical protein